VKFGTFGTLTLGIVEYRNKTGCGSINKSTVVSLVEYAGGKRSLRAYIACVSRYTVTRLVHAYIMACTGGSRL